MRKKNLVLAGVLALFFGPFGVFYSSIGLGFIMLVVDLVLAFFLSSAVANDVVSVGGAVAVVAAVNVLVGVLAARGRNRDTKSSSDLLT